MYVLIRTLLALCAYAAIPVALWAVLSLRRLRRDYDRLRRENWSLKQDLRDSTRQGTEAAGATVETVRPHPAEPSVPRPPAEPVYTPPRAAEYRRPAPRTSPAGVLLIVGVVLITLAGLTFTVTTWNRLNAGPRILLVFSQSALFFLVSALARRRLGLRGTGLAFYVLGVLYLPIAILAAGGLGLFGAWFSLSGSGRYLVLLTALLALGTGAGLGIVLYRKRPFAWVVYGTLSLSVISLSLAIHEAAGTAMLTAAVYCGAFSLLLPRLLRRAEEGGLWAAFLKEGRRAAPLQTAAAAVLFLLFAAHGVLGFITAAIFAALLPGLSDALPGEGAGAYPAGLYLLLSLFLLAPAGSGLEISFWLCGIALLVILHMTGLFPRATGRGLMLTGVAGLVLIGIYSAAVWPGWTVSLLLSVLVLTGAVTYAALRGDRLLRALQPAMVLLSLWGLTALLPLGDYGLSVAALLFAVCYFLYDSPCKALRTPVSDALFILATGAGALLSASPWAGLLLHLPLLGQGVLEARRYRHGAWLIPLALMSAALSLARLLPGAFSWILVTAALTGLGLWTALSGHPVSRALRLPMTVSVPVFVVLCGWLDLPAGSWLWMIPAAVAGVLMAAPPPTAPGLSRRHGQTLSLVWLYSGLVLLLPLAGGAAPVYLILGLLLSILGVAGPYRWGRSLVSAPAVCTLYAFSSLLVTRLIPDQVWFRNLDVYLLFPLFLALGRLLFDRVMDRKAREADWFTILATASVSALIFGGAALWGWLMAGVAALSFYRRTGSRRGDRLALTACWAALCFAAWTRLSTVPVILFSPLLLDPPLLGLAVLHTCVWRSRGSGTALYGYTIFTTLWLAGGAMVNGYLSYVLLLGLGALAVLLTAYAWRSRRWFLYAAVTLLALGVYATRRFWASLAWWVYLLAAGVVLLLVGAANERAKQRGGLRRRASLFFQDWHW